MINYKSPIFWIFVSGLFVFALATALVPLAKWLGILSAIGWLMMGFAACWFWFNRYREYKDSIKDAKFQDAYLYAERNDNPELIDQFGYDKKTERKLKWNSFNNFLTPLCGVLFLITGIVMLITTIKGL